MSHTRSVKFKLGCRRCGGWGHIWLSFENRATCDRCNGTGEDSDQCTCGGSDSQPVEHHDISCPRAIMCNNPTPTPWEVSDARSTCEDKSFAMVVGGKGHSFGLVAEVTVDEDAALIVKAVNNHGGLVRALLEIRRIANCSANQQLKIAQIYAIATQASRLEYESGPAEKSRSS